MMGEMFTTSDTHFSHRADFIWKTRGFSSWEEHNEILIQNWNNKISKNDKVIHVGDICFQPNTQIDKILPRLNGKITLVLGNHDTRIGLLSKYCKCIAYFEMTIKNKPIVFSHIPIHPISFLGNSNFSNK